ncbi:MAG: hypothetical protein ACK4Z6_01035 [Candidatus Methylomirabilales bacterium]
MGGNGEKILTTPATRRRLFLTLALRRARPGTGSAEVFLKERRAMKRWPDLTGILDDLPWAVVGAVATRAYMPERATQDLDILVTGDRAEEVRTRLKAAGFWPVEALTIGGMTWRSPDGTLVDVLESPLAWVPEALSLRTSDPQGLPILTLPYLVLMKVEAGRTQDLADAARMLGLASEEARQATRQVFRRWLPEALEDLESLITLGRLEMGR